MRSGPRRPWPPSRSCASRAPTTSKSASGSWRPAPTTSSLVRSTRARSRHASRRCCCASSDRRTTRRSSPPTASRWRARSRVVAVYSPKGGVGTTTIATNIAIAAAQRRPDRVVLVDLDLQFGGVATHLNLDAEPDPRGRHPGRGGPARAGAAADVRDAPRQRPARPGGTELPVVRGVRSRRRTSRRSSGRCSRATSRSSSMPVPCSMSGRSRCSRPPRRSSFRSTPRSPRSKRCTACSTT